MVDPEESSVSSSAVARDEFRIELEGDWYHSYEEDEGLHLVYRPSSFEFPLARRPRESLRLRTEGSAGVGRPGPDDRSELAIGTWGIEDRLLTVEHPGGSHKFEIETVEMDRLVLRRKATKGQPNGNEEESGS